MPTLYVAYRNLDLAGDQVRMTDAKDILVLMLGLSGVVLGYYFGRVPADARATQAQQQASEASARAEQVSAKAEQVAEEAEKVATNTVLTRSGSGSGDDLNTHDVEQLRRQVRELRALTRT